MKLLNLLSEFVNCNDPLVRIKKKKKKANNVYNVVGAYLKSTRAFKP